MNDVFVDVAWLREHLDDPGIRVVDTRSKPHGGVTDDPTGAEQYAAGHIPGAVHLDYAADELIDPATPYATRVAPPERFARAMAAAGIGDETLVVAYDDGNVPYAARLLWMLAYYGHDNAKILAGGFAEWKTSGASVSTAPAASRSAAFTPRARPQLRASRAEVLAVSKGERPAQLLETQRDKTYAQRNRDIAGAKRLSGSQLLEDARGGRVASPERLAELVANAGIDPGVRTIVSCGSGVSASGSWVALRTAGFRDVAVYDGSWLEWDHDGLPTVPKPG
ncbi:MAG: sulfurtransferase [Candidatus Velthaea sp.]|jgi:thiosulfate/3-mercaptopyruvate sulfurtransferase